MDKAKLIDLLERVEKATVPDREIDALIEVVACGRDLVERVYLPTGTPCLCARNIEPPHDEFVVWCLEAGDKFRVKPYTTSIDAALNLVERIFPDNGGYLIGPMYSRILSGVGVEVLSEGRGLMPQLALLAALLRALIARAE